MKRLLAATLIYVMPAIADIKVIQSASIYSTYGLNAIVLYANEVGPIHSMSAPDLSKSSLYERDAIRAVLAVDWQSAKALDFKVGEERLTIDAVTFNGTVLNNAAVPGVFLISDRSRLAEWRHRLIANTTEVTERKIDSVQDLRQVLHELKYTEPTTVVLNAFRIYSDFGRIVTYGSIESVVTSYTLNHVVVGVCRKGFQTPYALGPSERDLVNALKGVPTISSCVKISAVKDGTYSRTKGGYDEVEQ